ncbi:hypothetical protein [Agrobacterium larrymoorei]|uniref:hypothetical protein n=1 Tax=Agrobacterium larrymoorei TaxID=160699 RepID=UPI0030BD8491
MSLMVVVRGAGGGTGYFVVEQPDDVTIARPFNTHRAAWRWIDRHEGRPVSRSKSLGIFIRESNGGVA